MYNKQANSSKSLVSFKWVTFCTTAWKHDTQDTSLIIGRTIMICLRCWLLSMVVGSRGLPDFSLCMNCVEWCCFQYHTQPFIMRRERRGCLNLKLECSLQRPVLHDGMSLLLLVIRSTMSESQKCTFWKLILQKFTSCGEACWINRSNFFNYMFYYYLFFF